MNIEDARHYWKKAYLEKRTTLRYEPWLEAQLEELNRQHSLEKARMQVRINRLEDQLLKYTQAALTGQAPQDSLYCPHCNAEYKSSVWSFLSPNGSEVMPCSDCGKSFRIIVDRPVIFSTEELPEDD